MNHDKLEAVSISVDARGRRASHRAVCSHRPLLMAGVLSLLLAVPAMAQTTPSPTTTPDTPSTTTSQMPSIDDLLNLPSPGAGRVNPDANDQGPDVIVPPPEPGGSPEQVFDRALDRMRQASDRMGEKLDVGLQTQRLQESVLELIDQVIASAAKQKSSSSSSKPKPGDPENGDPNNASPTPGQGSQEGEMANAGQSNQPNTSGQVGSRPMVDPATGKPLEEMKDQWGTLPPRLREQLLQGMNEQFSPIYKQLTEAYYLRLAKESNP